MPRSTLYTFPLLAVAALLAQDPLAIPLEDEAATSANASFGDLDGDGDLDVVLAKGRHWPLEDMVLLNDGHGRFTTRYPVGHRADRTYTTALADLDGDGDLDIVVGNDRPDPKLVHLNDGRGRFTEGGTFGDSLWPTRNVTVVDLTGDDRPDIVVANRGGPGNVSANFVCVNDGRGRFPGCDTVSTMSATTIGAADLDGDSHIDLVIPHRDQGQSMIHRNLGNGRFDAGMPFGPSESATRAIAVGDVNGDGRPDMVVGSDEGGVQIYWNRGGAAFSEGSEVGDPTDVAYSLLIADLDRDGLADIVVGNRNTPSVILRQRPDRAFTRLAFSDAAGAVYGMDAGDADGNGGLDLVAGRSGAPNMLYLNPLRPVR